MANTTTNMALKQWNLPADSFSHVELSANWDKVDAHDHTTGKGLQIPTAGLANAAVTNPKLADGSVITSKIADANVTTAKIADANVTTAKIADSNVTTAKIADANVTTAKIADANVTTAKIADANVTLPKYGSDAVSMLGVRNTAYSGRGKSIIATEETRTSTSPGTMATPDSVTVTLPTDGLIFIAYQATVKESVNGQALVSIYIGPTVLKFARKGVTPIGAAGTALSSGGGTANVYMPLYTSPTGLVAASSVLTPTSYTDDATTGQVVGGDDAGRGGPCTVFAAAGTYAVSIQFQASSGSVTAKNRKLWVWTMGF